MLSDYWGWSQSPGVGMNLLDLFHSYVRFIAFPYKTDQVESVKNSYFLQDLSVLGMRDSHVKRLYEHRRTCSRLNLISVDWSGRSGAGIGFLEDNIARTSEAKMVILMISSGKSNITRGARGGWSCLNLA